ncbi:MAG: sigma-70 family RNA polymerase sigma factor [Cyclobacteriaceae bacterium]
MSTPDEDAVAVRQLIDHLFRKEYGRIVSYLTSIFGIAQLTAMEDIAQETLLDGFRNWSYHGIPPHPARWLYKVARNKAINYSKREQKKNKVFEIYYQSLITSDTEEIFIDREISDSMLRMIFACASPDLVPVDKVLLVLNTLCGFTRKEISNALLMEEEAVKKRLFRAKKRIRQSDVVLEVPSGEAQTERLQSVLSCLYLLFNEGYNSSGKDELIRKDVCLEAIRLTKLMVQHFENDTKSKALLSLMCFHAARFESRIDDKGAIILMKDQDRQAWDGELIDLGLLHLSQASVGLELSSYHLEAAIAYEHCRARSFEETNWDQIKKYYQELYHVKPSPIIKINQAIITGLQGDPGGAIEDLTKLQVAHKWLGKYYLYFATLGEFYRILGDSKKALWHFQKATELTDSVKELDLLAEKISTLK